jgi:hypothetical protein
MRDVLNFRFIKLNISKMVSPLDETSIGLVAAQRRRILLNEDRDPTLLLASKTTMVGHGRYSFGALPPEKYR